MPRQLKKPVGLTCGFFLTRPLTCQKTHGFFQIPTGEFNLYVAMPDFFTRFCIDGFKKPVLY